MSPGGASGPASKKRWITTVLWMVCLLLLIGCQSQKQDPSGAQVFPGGELSALRSEALKLINGMLEEEMIPGVSIALVDRSGPLWVEGFGYADQPTMRPVQADTVFRVGSLTKPLTALAVMQLQEAGRIDLDQPFTEQFEGFSIRSRGPVQSFTPRQMLSHRSGLPSDLRKGMYTATPFTQVAALLEDEYIAYPPNHVYSYSNLGYDLLGHLIAQRSGSTYQTYLQRHLFQPLQMRHSGFELDEVMEQRLAAGHLDGQVRPQPPLRDTPALGLYTSAADMARLLHALLRSGEHVLSAQSLREMWREQTASGQIVRGSSPGLGWFIEQDPLIGKVVRHGGSTLLFGAEISLLPERGLGVVVLTNGAEGNRYAHKIAATLLTLTLQLRGESLGVAKTLEDTSTAGEPEIAPGGYATDLGLLTIDPERPRLCACIIERVLDMVRFDDGSYGLTPESRESLPAAYRILGEMRFRSRRSGERDLLIVERNEKEFILGTRIDSKAWIDAWRERIGRYSTINPDGNFSIQNLRLSEESGVICLHYEAPHLSDGSIRVPLKPVSATEAIVEGLGRGSGETVSIVEINGKQCLKFSGYMSEPLEESP
jgi:CubicO group peptidase (beta-lactamase class C family)